MLTPKGLVSKIPVRQIRPPSKLPVPISSKENQPKKYPAQSKSSNIKNVVTRSQPKPSGTLLASRAKENLTAQKGRPGANKAYQNKSLLKQAGPKPKTVKNVSSKTQQRTHKAESALTTEEVFTSSQNPRLKNQGHLKGICKNSVNLTLQTKSSSISVQRNKNSLNKEALPGNGRLTSAASKIQNVNLAIAKNNIVDRRLTNISRKNDILVSKNLNTNHVDKKISSVDGAGMQRNNKFGIHVRKQSFQPEKFKNGNKKRIQEELSPSDDTPRLLGINLGEAENKTEFSSNEGFSNIQDDDEKENDENHCLQPDVEFVPDERYRNQILFGQGISPNIKPKQFKSSVIDRPSFFLKSKTALKHLERLEEAGRKESMLRMSGLKVRPSQPSICDPIQAVLRALENVDLAAEDRRVSAMRKNNPSYRSPQVCSMRSPMFNKPQQVDPYKTALKRIEELQMKKKAKSARKVTFNLESSVSSTKESQRNENPDCKKALQFSKEEILDDVFEEKTEPSFPNPEPKDVTPELQLPSNSSYTADKLERNLEIQDDVLEEKTQPSSCPNPEPKETTPELQLPPDSSYTAAKLERNLTQSHYYNMLLRVCDRICSPDKKKQQSSEGSQSDNFSIPDRKISPKKVGLKTLESTGATCDRSREQDIRNSLYLQRSQPIQHKRVSALTLNNRNREPTLSSTNSKAPLTPILKHSSRIYESVGPCFRTLSRFAEPAREDNRYSLYLPRRPMVEPIQEDTRYSLYLPRQSHQNLGEQDPRRSTLSKLCTPRPISFFPKPGNADSISPEFLCRRTSQIVAHAPISTPMVLRTMAANLEDSMSPLKFEEEDGQVCQRLDFDDESDEKLVPRASISTPFKFNKCSISGVLTNQQILDNLADEECQAFSAFTWLPGNGDRNFWNPVARILTHGDDMHFVPLKLT